MKIGGIHANDSYTAEFVRDNLVIAANVIQEAQRVSDLLGMGNPVHAS